MPHERHSIPGWQQCRAVALAAGAALLLTACAADFFTQKPPPLAQPIINHKALSSEALADDFAALAQLITASPAEQLQMVGAAEQAVTKAPTPSLKLRLALLLGTPGQAGADLPRAQQMLQALSADPGESLLPGERSLIALKLQQIGDYLTLQSENRTLQAAAARADQIVGLKHRLDEAGAENARLRREIRQARAKLAAIANIEKSLNERKTGNEGRPK